MSDTKPTLETIRTLAQRLANTNNDLTATSAHLNAEIKAAIGPILDRYRDTLDAYAAAKAKAQADLDFVLLQSPGLFVRPRSLRVDGVSCGYRKEEDSYEFDDEAAVIAAIKALLPELAPLLIRSTETLIPGALGQLEPEQRQRVGIRHVTGVDRRYIVVGDNDTEKIAKIALASASSRQGEEEAEKKTGKRVKIKEAA